jgi:hypothetical protein
MIDAYVEYDGLWPFSSGIQAPAELQHSEHWNAREGWLEAYASYHSSFSLHGARLSAIAMRRERISTLLAASCRQRIL